jgi:hypothetical protein
MAADASKDAAQTQANATLQAQQMNLEAQKPWLDAGKAALTQLQADVLGPNAKFGQPFTMADAKNSEAYKEAMRGGTEAIQSSAAARGGLLSTNTLQDLTKFGESTAAGYQNQAFNQWLAERAALLSPVQSLANVGQTTAQQVGETNANLALTRGNAIAGGQIGSANAWGSGINNAIQQFTMLDGMFKQPAGSTVGYTPTMPAADYSLGGMSLGGSGSGFTIPGGR